MFSGGFSPRTRIPAARSRYRSRNGSGVQVLGCRGRFSLFFLHDITRLYANCPAYICGYGLWSLVHVSYLTPI